MFSDRKVLAEVPSLPDDLTVSYYARYLYGGVYERSDIKVPFLRCWPRRASRGAGTSSAAIASISPGAHADFLLILSKFESKHDRSACIYL
jgi:hypothetical protein